jgi:hypothetical protein
VHEHRDLAVDAEPVSDRDHLGLGVAPPIRPPRCRGSSRGTTSIASRGSQQPGTTEIVVSPVRVRVSPSHSSLQAFCNPSQGRRTAATLRSPRGNVGGTKPLKDRVRETRVDLASTRHRMSADRREFRSTSGIPYNGAAKESNLPTTGLPPPTGFEDVWARPPRPRRSTPRACCEATPTPSQAARRAASKTRLSGPLDGRSRERGGNETSQEQGSAGPR